MNKQTSTDLIVKIKNSVISLIGNGINDKTQKILVSVFGKIKNKNNWKAPTLPLSFTFTFSNYERVIQTIGLIAMAFSHFHGGYELNRVGNSDTVVIRSAGYYVYVN